MKKSQEALKAYSRFKFLQFLIWVRVTEFTLNSGLLSISEYYFCLNVFDMWIHLILTNDAKLVRRQIVFFFLNLLRLAALLCLSPGDDDFTGNAIYVLKFLKFVYVLSSTEDFLKIWRHKYALNLNLISLI